MRNGSTPNPLGLSTIVVAKKVVEKKKTFWEMALHFPVKWLLPHYGQQ